LLALEIKKTWEEISPRVPNSYIYLRGMGIPLGFNVHGNSVRVKKMIFEGL